MDSIVSSFTWGRWKSAATCSAMFLNTDFPWIDEGLKKFAAHACSACSLDVASTEHGFFTKWVKSLPTTYVPEKEKGFAQVI